MLLRCASMGERYHELPLPENKAASLIDSPMNINPINPGVDTKIDLKTELLPANQ